jgi:hypothetical protein
MRGGGGQKMYVFVHALGIKTVHEGGALRPEGAENIPLGSQVSDLCF